MRLLAIQPEQFIQSESTKRLKERLKKIAKVFLFDQYKVMEVPLVYFQERNAGTIVLRLRGVQRSASRVPRLDQNGTTRQHSGTLCCQ